MSYCEVSEARALVGEDLDPLLLDAAMEAIERWSGRRWLRAGEAAAATYVERHDGRSDPVLVLGRRPVVAVTALTLDGHSALAELNAGIYLDAAGGRLIRSGGWHALPQGVSVTYTAGSTANPPPANYKAAEAQLAAAMRENPTALSSEGIGSASWGYGQADQEFLAIMRRCGIPMALVFA